VSRPEGVRGSRSAAGNTTGSGDLGGRPRGDARRAQTTVARTGEGARWGAARMRSSPRSRHHHGAMAPARCAAAAARRGGRVLDGAPPDAGRPPGGRGDGAGARWEVCDHGADQCRFQVADSPASPSGPPRTRRSHRTSRSRAGCRPFPPWVGSSNPESTPTRLRSSAKTPRSTPSPETAVAGCSPAVDREAGCRRSRCNCCPPPPGRRRPAPHTRDHRSQPDTRAPPD